MSRTRVIRFGSLSHFASIKEPISPFMTSGYLAFNGALQELQSAATPKASGAYLNLASRGADLKTYRAWLYRRRWYQSQTHSRRLDP